MLRTSVPAEPTSLRMQTEDANFCLLSVCLVSLTRVSFLYLDLNGLRRQYRAARDGATQFSSLFPEVVFEQAVSNN